MRDRTISMDGIRITSSTFDLRPTQSITIAASNSRKLIATACKATTPKHAVVRVYDTETFQPVGQPLGGHSLTITRIAFSPDDRFVLTVSRDRSWHLYERNEDGGACFDAFSIPTA